LGRAGRVWAALCAHRVSTCLMACMQVQHLPSSKPPPPSSSACAAHATTTH
jgi:hypothetical protein